MLVGDGDDIFSQDGGTVPLHPRKKGALVRSFLRWAARSIQLADMFVRCSRLGIMLEAKGPLSQTDHLEEGPWMSRAGSLWSSPMTPAQARLNLKDRRGWNCQHGIWCLSQSSRFDFLLYFFIIIRHPKELTLCDNY